MLALLLESGLRSLILGAAVFLALKMLRVRNLQIGTVMISVCGRA